MLHENTLRVPNQENDTLAGASTRVHNYSPMSFVQLIFGVVAEGLFMTSVGDNVVARH